MITIGLGHQKQTGKDTIADMLVKDCAFKKLSFAAPLKELVDICNRKEGYAEGLAYWSGRYGLGKDHPVYSLLMAQEFPADWKELEDGKQRKFLQWLGTEVFRNQVAQDFWVWALDKLRTTNFKEWDVVITDVRFPNELAYIKKVGYDVHVVRDTGRNDTHPSEVSLLGADWNYTVTNNKGLPELTNQVWDLMSTIYGKELGE